MTEPGPLALAGLFDDAGLFPPAEKVLDDALRDHRLARASAYGWMVGRFLVPALGLPAYVAALDAEDCWGTSVVLREPLDGDAEVHRAEMVAVAANAQAARVEGLEVRLPHGDPDGAVITTVLERLDALGLPTPVELWLEVPLAGRRAIGGWLQLLRAAGPLPATVRRIGAKIRCGGLTADAFPGISRLVEFIDAADEAGIPFKATAGLHHAFPYEDPAIDVRQHGFLNLFAAVALGRSARATVLADGALTVDDDGLRCGEISVGLDQLAATRRQFVAIGSCSFTEPVADLVARGLIPEVSSVGRGT